MTFFPAANSTDVTRLKRIIRMPQRGMRRSGPSLMRQMARLEEMEQYCVDTVSHSFLDRFFLNFEHSLIGRGLRFHYVVNFIYDLLADVSTPIAAKSFR